MNNKSNKDKTQQIEEKIIINGSASANFEKKFFKSIDAQKALYES